MKIISTKKTQKNICSVIFFRNFNDLDTHDFYKDLSEEGKLTIQKILEKKDLAKSELNYFFLKDGPVILGWPGEKGSDPRNIIPILRKIVSIAKKAEIREFQLRAKDFLLSNEDMDFSIETLATQLSLADYEHLAYKTPPKKGWPNIQRIMVFAEGSIERSIERGIILGAEINAARELSNTPGGDMTPASLAAKAKAMAKDLPIQVKILGVNEMKKMGMGGILGVSQGSNQPPRFVVMEYMAGPQKESPVVMVGKGITFDSGGLNIKPSEHIYEMHMDMSGGAAVIHAICALARLKAKKNIVAIVPAAENMPSGSSYRPGDVLRTMAGKTIEILNTDAEGRVVLADGLEYSKKYKPRLVIDVATLTGAAMVALGQRSSAIFSTDPQIEAQLRQIGERTMDRVWPLPLWEEFEEDVKGTFGDWANTGKDRYGGAICGAVFLWQFIKPFPFVHFDIAPRMTSIEEDNLAKGAAGAPVNLLVHFLERF